MSIKINMVTMEPGDSLIISHRGSAEISLSIVCREKGVEVSGPMNCTAQKHFLDKNGRWEESAHNKKNKASGSQITKTHNNSKRI